MEGGLVGWPGSLGGSRRVQTAYVWACWVQGTPMSNDPGGLKQEECGTCMEAGSIWR